jgi:glycosyltransferase involved in cell wall biosynthesis
LKILQITHAYPPYPGGLSHVVYHISHELARMGIFIDILTMKNHVVLNRLEYYSGRIRVFREWGYSLSNAYFIPSHKFVERLMGIIRGNNYDAIHIHNIGSISTPISLLILKKLLREKYSETILTPHHHEAGSRFDTRIMWLFYKPLIRKIIRLADKIHAVSILEKYLLMRDFDLEDIIVIPNGVASDVYNYRWKPPDKPVIVYAGRVERYKNIDKILYVTYILRKEYGLNVSVKIIGEGRDLVRILNLAKKLGIEVEAKGFLPRKEYLLELSRSSVFMNLSSYEAYSIVSAEAIAMGVPTITSKPWGLVFKPYNAFIVDKNDLNSIAELTYRIINNKIVAYKKQKIPTWREIAYRYLKELYM